MRATFHIKREQIQKFHMVHFTSLGNMFHFHSQIELFWVRRGAAEAWINELRVPVGENEIAVILSYEAHQYQQASPPRDGEYTSLFIPVFLCPEFVEAVRHKKLRQPVIRDPRALAQIRSAIERLSDENLNSVEQTGWLHVILGTVLAQMELQEIPSDRTEDLPQQLLFYINEHFREDITAESMAQEFGYSTDHLAKSFRACFHMGIARYVNTLRLKDAVVRMREKKATITECALESGFGSLRTFYRVFEEEFGCSPREYLRQE